MVVGRGIEWGGVWLFRSRYVYITKYSTATKLPLFSEALGNQSLVGGPQILDCPLHAASPAI